MQRKILPANKLTKSEQLLLWSLRFLVLDVGFLLLGAFLFLPLIIGPIAAGYFWWWAKKRKYQIGPPSGIHGTAHFATADEIAAAGLIGRLDGLIVGMIPSRANGGPRPGIIAILKVPVWDIARVRRLLERYTRASRSQSNQPRRDQLVRLPASDKMSHSAFYIPTGFGKTWGVVIPNLMCCDENAVAYDPSGVTFQQTAEFRRRHFGHRIYLIDPFGVTGIRGSDRLNPLDLVAADDFGRLDFCMHLAQALVVEKLGMNREQFWHSATVACTVFLLMVITLEKDGKYRNLASLGELLVPKRLHGIAKAYSNHEDPVVRRRAEQILNFQSKTLDSLLACMTAEHSWLDSPAFSSVLSESTFSARNLQREKATVYIVIPGNRAVESQPFLRTLMTAFLYAAFEAGPDIRRPALRFYLDEVATIGKLDLLMTLYTQGRKFGLRSCNFFQSVGQVADIVGGPEKIQTFRANMAAELFKPKDYQSAKETSDWIGQMTAPTISTSWQSGTNSGWSNSHGSQMSQGQSGGSSENSSRTVSETGVLAMRPEEILQMGEQEAILLTAGTPAVKVNIIRAEDALNCGATDAVGRSESVYLFRVRCYIFLSLLVVAPAFVMGYAFVMSGIDQWTRQNLTVQQPVQAEQAMLPAPESAQRRAADRPQGGRRDASAYRARW